MGRYVYLRLANAAVVLLIVTSAVFVFIRLAPGGPSILMSDALTPEDVAVLKRNLGLDQPVYVQYVKWMLSACKGDFGISFITGRPVTQEVLERVAPTVILGLSALAFSVVVSVPVGIASALRRGGLLDSVATVVAFLGVSMPVFWFGLMLILLFSVQLRILPSAGMYSIGATNTVMDLLLHLLMPTVVLGLSNAAELTRYTRAAMLHVLRQDYVRTARAKGLRESAVTYKHALKNAMVTISSVIGLSLPRLVGGAALTEVIFAWPGMGRLAVTSALQRDYPVVMGVTVLVAVMVVLCNLMVDLMYPLFDPRIKVGSRSG